MSIVEYEADTARMKRVMMAGVWFTYYYLPGTDLKSRLQYGGSGSAYYTYEPNRDLLTQVRNHINGGVISQYDYVNDAVRRQTALRREMRGEEHWHKPARVGESGESSRITLNSQGCLPAYFCLFLCLHFTVPPNIIFTNKSGYENGNSSRSDIPHSEHFAYLFTKKFIITAAKLNTLTTALTYTRLNLTLTHISPSVRPKRKHPN